MFKFSVVEKLPQFYINCFGDEQSPPGQIYTFFPIKTLQGPLDSLNIVLVLFIRLKMHVLSHFFFIYVLIDCS